MLNLIFDCENSVYAVACRDEVGKQARILATMLVRLVQRLLVGSVEGAQYKRDFEAHRIGRLIRIETDLVEGSRPGARPRWRASAKRI